MTNKVLFDKHATNAQNDLTATPNTSADPQLSDIVSQVVGKRLEDGRSITNSSGFIAETQFADGSTLYFQSGRPVKLLQKSGKVTSYGFDAEGRHLRTVHPDGTMDAFQYDENGRKVSAGVN